jgi:hypothetical protein
MLLEASPISDPERPAASRDEHVLDGSDFERMLGRVHASLDAERGLRGRLRALPTRVRSLLVATAVILVGGGALVFARRVDFDAYPRWRLLLNAATYAGLLALVSSLVLRPLHRRPVSASWETALATVGLLAPFGWALAPMPVLSRAVDPVGGGRDCLVVGIVLGTALAVLLRSLDRAPQTSLRSAALFAAGAGLLANLALVFHCPRTRPMHLALVHAPMGLLLLFAYGVVLAGLGRRFAR